MDAIRDYVVLIGGFLIFQALIEGLLPAHTSRKYIRLVLGVIFLLILIQPLQNLFHWEPSFDSLMAEEGQEGYESRIQQMTSAQYERFLEEKGLPERWREEWKIKRIKVTCPEGIPEQIEVQVNAGKGEEKIDPIQIRLGTIGQQERENEEEEQLLQDLAAYWGFDVSRLQVRIEGN